MTYALFLKNIYERALDIVLPPRCVVSGAIVDGAGRLSPEAWQGLHFIAAPHCARCGLPFEFSVEEGDETLCVSCLEKPPAYDTARAALVYNDASRALILRFKHADHIHAASVFVPWLKTAAGTILPDADFLIPVPLHPRRLLKRRYNQACLLAQALTAETGVPCLPDALMRCRATPPQGHKDYKERHKNVRRAFVVRPSWCEKLKGKRVVLLDDVYTTGATVEECARVLRIAGVEAVHVLAVARVVRHS